MPTALPAATDYTGASVTQGGKKTFMTAVRTYLAELLGTSGAKSGAIATLGIESSSAIRNLALSAAVASSALTMAVKTRAGSDPTTTDVVTVAMRDASAGGGGFTERQAVAALSLTVPSGATLGHASSIAGWLYWYVIDNAGTLELAVSAQDFGALGIVSTSAINSSSTSGYTMYSASARTGVAFRRIGRTRDTQSTAGAWGALPSLIELEPYAVAMKAGPLGQCRVSKVSSNVVLQAYRGNLLSFPAGDAYVPSAGVTLAASGLTPDTLYYLYAIASAGMVSTMEASTTVPAEDAQTGIVVKTGDPTRVLVGMAMPVTGPAWVDASTQRFVRSWFNDPGIAQLNTLGSDTTIGFGPWAELAGMRVSALLWNNERIFVHVSAAFDETVSGSADGFIAPGVNTTTAPSGSPGVTSFDASSGYKHASGHASLIASPGAVGGAFGYFTLVTGVGGGTTPKVLADYTAISVVTSGRP